MIRWLLNQIVEAQTGGKQTPKGTSGLPIEAQNYIDNKIRDAIDRVNDQTDRRLRDIVKDKFRLWDKVGTYWTSFWIIAAISGWFGGKEYLRKNAEQAAREYLTTNIVHQAMAEVFRSNVTNFTQAELQPLNRQIKEFEERIAVAVSNFSVEQAQLAQEQRAIKEQQLILDLSVRAKGGDAHAYDDLKRRGTNSLFSSTAKAAELDVGFYFMNFVRPENNLFHTAKGQLITESVEDDIWHLFQPDAEARVVAAYQLRLHKKPGTLMALVEALRIETNLFARAQIITTIGALKGRQLHCLDLEAVFKLVSGETNSITTNRWYGCLVEKPRIIDTPLELVDEFIRCATMIIDNEPFALRTRCARGWFYAKKGDLVSATKDFAEVEKLSANDPWLWFYRGLMEIGYNEERAGISSLNRAFQGRPDLAEYAKGILASRWHTNSEILWPKQ